MTHKLMILAAISSAALISTAQAEAIQSSLSAFVAEDCKPVVEDYLDRHNIDKAQIKVTDYITYLLAGGEFGEEKEFQAWVSFKSCTGNLVIKMDRGCYIQTDYTTNQCDTKGLPKN